MGPVTKEELLVVLADDMGHDLEVAHSNADDALLAYIGDPEITSAFYSVTKWYA
jgi:hypothetical protein